MKKVFLLTFYSLFTAFATHAQSNTVTVPYPAAIAKPETLLLKEPTYSFGKIPQGRPVIHIFEIENISKEPLLLENVQASCGCTTPEWSRDPIAAGAITPMLRDILTKLLRSFTTTDRRKR
jgi:hypothetical protein